MSAIWGNISYTGKQPDNTLFLLDAAYRTSCRIDCIKNISENGCIMGCGIQYITAEARSERLPIYDDKTGIFFTADCILDNRKELIAKLNLRDASVPDGMIIFKAYLKWGIECVSRLRGLFSFAVYESSKNTLYLAADQTSGRCLYYYRHNDGITFSTLLAPIKELHPCLEANSDYFRDFLTSPGLMPNITPRETPFRSVYKLTAGTFLSITPDAVIETSYWTPQSDKAFAVYKNAAEYGAAFRELYSKCVRDALRTDGETAITLSSGLDSGSVGAFAAKHLQAAGKKLYAYTYVPCEAVGKAPKNLSTDETADVLRFAEMYPNVLTHFLNNNGKNCLEDMGTVLGIMEIPVKAVVNLPNLLEIYKNARNDGCKLVLSGQSGNSTVSNGYIDNILYDLCSSGHFITFLLWLNSYSLTVKESRTDALRGCLRYFKYASREYRMPYMHDYTPQNPFLAADILKDYPIRERYSASCIPMYGSLPVPGDIYHKYFYHRAAFAYLGELDTKMGLATGTVLRDPTRDMRMLSFCCHMPYIYFAYKGTPRWLIRGNLRDMLPDAYLNNWLRYSVQNYDWLMRLRRDSDYVKTVLKDSFSPAAAEKLGAYIDCAGINAFIDSMSLEDSADNRLDYLLYCLSFSMYLSNI